MNFSPSKQEQTYETSKPNIRNMALAAVEIVILRYLLMFVSTMFSHMAGIIIFTATPENTDCNRFID